MDILLAAQKKGIRGLGGDRKAFSFTREKAQGGKKKDCRSLDSREDY